MKWWGSSLASVNLPLDYRHKFIAHFWRIELIVCRHVRWVLHLVTISWEFPFIWLLYDHFFSHWPVPFCAPRHCSSECQNNWHTNRCSVHPAGSKIYKGIPGNFVSNFKTRLRTKPTEIWIKAFLFYIVRIVRRSTFMKCLWSRQVLFVVAWGPYCWPHRICIYIYILIICALLDSELQNSSISINITLRKIVWKGHVTCKRKMGKNVQHFIQKT